jgi:hypothetical protein
MKYVTRFLLAAGGGAALLAITLSAQALPTVGTDRPDAALVDGWDRPNELKRYTGMPILVVYEDKDSATVNQAFKDELAKLAADGRYKKIIALFAVADVTGYDYWPVRGFVKDAIRDESKKQNTVIYCDWNGSFRESLRLDRGTSNIVLFGKNGKVLFSYAGALPADQRKLLIAQLRAQADGA